MMKKSFLRAGRKVFAVFMAVSLMSATLQVANHIYRNWYNKEYEEFSHWYTSFLYLFPQDGVGDILIIAKLQFHK